MAVPFVRPEVQPLITPAVNDEQPLIRTFVELADTLVEDYDLPEFLYRLLVHCTNLFGAAAAGLMLRSPAGGVELVASSSERSEHLELVQIQTASGPCVDCIEAGEPVRSPDLTAEVGRWPLWTPGAIEAGFRSVYASPMKLRLEVIGAFNLFATTPHALSEDDLAVVQALADIATIGILQARVIRRAETLSEQLQVALDSRILVEQAKGIVAGRTDLDVTVDRAFLMIRDHARRTGTKLTVVCRDIITGALDPRTLQAT